MKYSVRANAGMAHQTQHGFYASESKTTWASLDETAKVQAAFVPHLAAASAVCLPPRSNTAETFLSAWKQSLFCEFAGRH